MAGETIQLTAAHLLRAYAMGIFPMAESRNSPDVFWMEPRHRGVFPLEGFHCARSLQRRIRRGGYEVRVDTEFALVLDACADRPETWINPTIRTLYLDLHAAGHAHSQEIWREGRLIGGVYGVVLGAAFFGESMFSRETDASKLALVHLIDRLRLGGFTLFDTQYLTPHLASLGAIEIPRAQYQARLAKALTKQANFQAIDALSAAGSATPKHHSADDPTHKAPGWRQPSTH